MQDDVEYADGAQLFMGKDTHGQMCERLGNCDISTETRELEIQWIDVLLVHAGRDPEKDTPPPFDQIKFSRGGTILGKAIYMAKTLARQQGEESEKKQTHGNT